VVAGENDRRREAADKTIDNAPKAARETQLCAVQSVNYEESNEKT
jgi:hypothetical protein